MHRFEAIDKMENVTDAEKATLKEAVDAEAKIANFNGMTTLAQYTSRSRIMPIMKTVGWNKIMGETVSGATMTGFDAFNNYLRLWRDAVVASIKGVDDAGHYIVEATPEGLKALLAKLR